MSSRRAYGQCFKNEPVTGMSCVRDLYLHAALKCTAEAIDTSHLDCTTWKWFTRSTSTDTSAISGSILKNVRNWKVSVIFLSVRLSESPAFNMLWAAVKCFQAKLLTGLRKQIETVSKQLPSPCQWNLFPDHKNFQMSFSVVLHFYPAITTRLEKYQSQTFM